MARIDAEDGSNPNEATAPAWLPKVIELLRAKTGHDFTLYKPGTLKRRIERRMALVALETHSIQRYLELLEGDADELVLLAEDLLVNVTGYFRDPEVFDQLADRIAPDLVLGQPPDRPLRIWIAGCSTGEEAYSLAILFREAIAAANREVKLQVFASDIDADALAIARVGLYPSTIEADISPGRLARFFSKEDHGYRVSPELRGTVVFTDHDVLEDPPFSRLDLVSCRNLLIYLGPEGQARVISLFDFALREGGILLLGAAETIGAIDGRFEVIAKAERLYRRVGHSRPGELGLSRTSGNAARPPSRPARNASPSTQTAFADLCRKLVLDAYAPAAVLINERYELLHSMGPTDRFLQVAPGRPSHDLLAMARHGVSAKLRSAIQQARHENARVVVHGDRLRGEDGQPPFAIDVHPVSNEGQELLLVCFVDEPGREGKRGSRAGGRKASRLLELEQELESTRKELQGAIRNLEISSDEQRAASEEALSVNEEYQSTNEELLTSKEEYQSINEELTALNGQLQETLERQRTLSNDLQNVLYSTDVATLFLDPHLNIRFFTPATKWLFSIIPSDVGRPLADLNSLAADAALITDAQAVLETLEPVEREIEARTGAWYVRRILPYRTGDNGVEGIVVTFADITERRHTADALGAAKQQAELANAAKSRFLAAASHDLRQPLQTLALLQGLLAKTVVGEEPQTLVSRLDDTLGAMSGMLNTLLDINQIEVGSVRPEVVSFPIGNLLSRLKDEFTYLAQARRLALHVVSSRFFIESDPRLLEQMIRNLLSNALKYTKDGKVLLGCRRRDGMLNIEVWDTGVGIPDDELQAIFDEYHQLDNPARERSRGLGLGLSIVQRLGGLLGHTIHVRSHRGKGSVFTVQVTLPSSQSTPRVERTGQSPTGIPVTGVHRTGSILVVEDDPEVRQMLVRLLGGDGHRVEAAADGLAALERVARGAIQPDLILADYNLPNGSSGLQLTARTRGKLRRTIPAIILTGDLSTETLRAISAQDCVPLNKPVKVDMLTQVIQRLLTEAQAAAPARVQPRDPTGKAAPVIFIVDDDAHVRDAIRRVLEDDGQTVEDYAAGETFLAAYHRGRGACLLIDAYLPGMTGLDVLERLHGVADRMPAIMITGNSDVPMAVQAMKAGASDFIEKPFRSSDLLASVHRALEQARDSSKLDAWRQTAASLMAGLTARQRQIMDLVLAGHPSKNIAADLRISQRTVESHRAAIMKKTDSKSLPALARLAVAGGSAESDFHQVPASRSEKEPP